MLPSSAIWWYCSCCSVVTCWAGGKKQRWDWGRDPDNARSQRQPVIVNVIVNSYYHVYYHRRCYHRNLSPNHEMSQPGNYLAQCQPGKPSRLLQWIAGKTARPSIMECFDPCAALASRRTAVSSFTQQQQIYWPIAEGNRHAQHKARSTHVSNF